MWTTRGGQTAGNKVALREDPGSWKPKNAFQRYLQKLADSGGDFSQITSTDVSDAWDVVRSKFNAKYKAKYGGKDYDDIHHDLFKSLFPEYAFDPANLYPMIKIEHKWIHDILSGGRMNYSLLENRYLDAPGPMGHYFLNRETVSIGSEGGVVRTDRGTVSRSTED